MQTEKPEKYGDLKKMVKTDNFVRYVLTNIDTSLAATDEKIIKMYAGLVENKKVKTEILGLLLNELSLTREMMIDLLGSSTHKRRKNHYYSTNLRAEALLPLHQEQIKLLKEWRKIQSSGDKEKSEKLLHSLLRSINAIANAMGTTG